LLVDDFVTNSELHAFIRGLGKTISWFHMLSVRYGLIPKPIIRSQTGVPAHKWKLRSKDHQQRIFKKPGRVFLYSRKVMPLIKDIIREHEVNHLTYAEISKKLRDRVIEINAEMGYKDGVEKGRGSFSNRLRDEGFFQNFRTALRVGRELGIVDGSVNAIEGLAKLEESARDLMATYHTLLGDRKSNPDSISKSHLESMGLRLDLLHSTMENTIRFVYKTAKKQNRLGLWHGPINWGLEKK
jgi:hypothetical protein